VFLDCHSRKTILLSAFLKLDIELFLLQTTTIFNPSRHWCILFFVFIIRWHSNHSTLFWAPFTQAFVSQKHPTNQQLSYHLIAAKTNFNGFDKHIMENLKLLDATPQGAVDIEFLIDERYTNINGVMHGGAAGVIFDMCTTSALGPLAKPGFWE
jgi:hypothetical protein